MTAWEEETLDSIRTSPEYTPHEQTEYYFGVMFVISGGAKSFHCSPN